MVKLNNFSKDELIEKMETIKEVLEVSPTSFEVGSSLHFVSEVLSELYDSEEVPDED